MAASRVGRAVYELEADNRGLRRDLDNAERDLRAAGKEGERAFGRAAQRGPTMFGRALRGATGQVGRFGGAIKGVGKTLVMGMGFGIAAAAANEFIGFLKGSIDSASDLAEQTSKTRVVFGEFSSDIENWANTSAQAMGISRREALASVSTFGNLFQAMEVGRPEAAEMSKGLIQLAADLASFNNANPEEVLVALQSGMVGQVEPMRRFGVEMSAAAVNAKALEMGLAATAKELTAQDKIQARYAILLAQTTTAQGDFTRTADGMANSQRIAKAQFEDLSGQVGNFVLPAMNALMKFILTSVVPGLMTVAGAVQTWIAENQPLIDQVSEFVSGVLEGLRHVLVDVLVPAFNGLVTEIGGFIGSITGPGSATEGVGDLVAKVGELASKIVGPVVAALSQFWDWLKESGILQGAIRIVVQTLDGLVTIVSDIWDAISEPKAVLARTAIIGFLVFLATTKAALTLFELAENTLAFGRALSGVLVASVLPALPIVLLAAGVGLVLLVENFQWVKDNFPEVAHGIEEVHTELTNLFKPLDDILGLFRALEQILNGVNQLVLDLADAFNDVRADIAALTAYGGAADARGTWGQIPKTPGPPLGPPAGAFNGMMSGASSLGVSSGRLEVVVRDAGGGLAKAGISTGGLAEAIGNQVSGYRRNLRIEAGSY